MSRWWSLTPVSTTHIFWKLFGLFVKIKSIHVPVDILKHVFDLIILIKSLSHIKVFISWLVGSILKSPRATMFSKLLLHLPKTFLSSVIKQLLHYEGGAYIATTNHFCFLRFISTGKIWMSLGESRIKLFGNFSSKWPV